MNRRNSLAVIGSFALFAISSRSQSSGPLISVFKTPTCSCCGKWVEHLKASGFTVKVREVNSTAAYQKQYRVPRGMESCHTAVANGYAIEGHVPAADIKRLLMQRPKLAGLAVPGSLLRNSENLSAPANQPSHATVHVRFALRPVARYGGAP